MGLGRNVMLRGERPASLLVIQQRDDVEVFSFENLRVY
jgi:hypothetical protein